MLSVIRPSQASNSLSRTRAIDQRRRIVLTTKIPLDGGPIGENLGMKEHLKPSGVKASITDSLLTQWLRQKNEKEKRAACQARIITHCRSKAKSCGGGD